MEPTKKEEPEPLTPEQAHQLLGVHGPYDPPPRPPAFPGYITFWDAGCSIPRVRERHRDLFFPDDWYHGQAFAKQSDSWRWRQIRLKPSDSGKPFAEQEVKVSKGDAVASARELVVFLVLHFLTTGERVEIGRRCREVLPSGRRVIVGPLHELVLTLGSMADEWASEAFGLATVFTPRK